MFGLGGEFQELSDHESQELCEQATSHTTPGSFTIGFYPFLRITCSFLHFSEESE